MATLPFQYQKKPPQQAGQVPSGGLPNAGQPQQAYPQPQPRSVDPSYGSMAGKTLPNATQPVRPPPQAAGAAPTPTPAGLPSAMGQQGLPQQQGSGAGASVRAGARQQAAAAAHEGPGSYGEMRDVWAETMANQEDALKNQLLGIGADESINAARAADMNGQMSSSVSGAYQSGQIQAQLGGSIARSNAIAENAQREAEMRMAYLDKVYESAERQNDRDTMERIEQERNQLQRDINAQNLKQRQTEFGAQYPSVESNVAFGGNKGQYSNDSYNPWSGQTFYVDGGRPVSGEEAQGSMRHEVQRAVDAGWFPASMAEEVLRAAGQLWAQNPNNPPRIESVLKMMGYGGY